MKHGYPNDPFHEDWSIWSTLVNPVTLIFLGYLCSKYVFTGKGSSKSPQSTHSEKIRAIYLESDLLETTQAGPYPCSNEPTLADNEVIAWTLPQALKILQNDIEGLSTDLYQRVLSTIVTDMSSESRPAKKQISERCWNSYTNMKTAEKVISERSLILLLEIFVTGRDLSRVRTLHGVLSSLSISPSPSSFAGIVDAYLDVNSVELAEKILKNSPKNKSVCMPLLQYYSRTSRWLKACSLMHEMRRHGSLDTEVFDLVVETLLYSKKEDLAIEIFEEFRQEGVLKFDVDSLSLIMLCYIQLNTPFKALGLYEEIRITESHAQLERKVVDLLVASCRTAKVPTNVTDLILQDLSCINSRRSNEDQAGSLNTARALAPSPYLYFQAFKQAAAKGEHSKVKALYQQAQTEGVRITSEMKEIQLGSLLAIRDVKSIAEITESMLEAPKCISLDIYHAVIDMFLESLDSIISVECATHLCTKMIQAGLPIPTEMYHGGKKVNRHSEHRRETKKFRI